MLAFLVLQIHTGKAEAVFALVCAFFLASLFTRFIGLCIFIYGIKKNKENHETAQELFIAWLVGMFFITLDCLVNVIPVLILGSAVSFFCIPFSKMMSMEYGFLPGLLSALLIVLFPQKYRFMKRIYRWLIILFLAGISFVLLSIC